MLIPVTPEKAVVRHIGSLCLLCARSGRFARAVKLPAGLYANPLPFFRKLHFDV